MIFRMAVGGNLANQADTIRQIDELTGQIKAYLFSEGKEKGAEIRWLVSPSYTDAGWKDKADAAHVQMHAFCLKQEEDWSDACSFAVKADSEFRGLAADWICKEADLILLVWDEDVSERGGMTWELMQHAYVKKTPCIWISSKSGQLYWLQNGYYGEYNPEYLKTLCQNLVFCGDILGEKEERKIPFLELGNKLQQRYLRKYEAESKVYDAKRDCLLREEYEFGKRQETQGGREPIAGGELQGVEAAAGGGESHDRGEARGMQETLHRMKSQPGSGREIHRKMLDEFKRYDRRAIEYGGKYRAIMYWRAILPLAASLFIGVGFYAETIFGILPIPWGIKPGLWGIMAAFGFLIHGMLNLYVYFLSKDKLVRSWHMGYIDNRILAEMYRILIHFLPYGVGLDIRKLCGSRRDIYALIRKSTEDSLSASFVLGEEETREILNHVGEMLEDQGFYHRSSAERYERVSRRLEQWNKWLFSIGFAVVILRGFIQFFISYMPLAGMGNGISLNSFVRSFANMAALLLPAWASYFASKLNQCNYHYHARNHREMEQAISVQLERVHRLQKTGDRVPLEVLGTLSEEIAELMLVIDTGEWYSKVGASSVTLL